MSGPRWPLPAGSLVTVLALGGLWWTAGRTEARLQAETDLALAQQAAAYLATVTPEGPGGYHVPALLSAAHRVAQAAFWPANLQVGLAGAPLLPDSVGLAPLPVRDLEALELGSGSVVARHAAVRATVVPLLDTDRWETVGWVAVWHGLAPRPRPVAAPLLTVAATLIALLAGVLGLAAPGLWSAAVARIGSVACLAALALVLGRGIRHAAAEATDLRLRTAHRLVDMAATASGVRREELPGIGIGLSAGRHAAVELPGDAILRRHEAGVTIARVETAIGRGEILAFETVAREGQLGLTRLALASWVLVGALGLGFAAWAARARADLMRFHEVLAAWGFLAPALAHLAVFSFLPALFTFFLAFHRWDLLAPGHPFAGLENFRAAFADDRFLHSLGVTALYALHVPVTTALALAAAVILDRAGLGIRVLRTILFVPFISSVVAIALVWQWIYQPEAGLLNSFLGGLGLPPRDWLGDPRTALLSLMAMSVWVQVGYQMVVLLGGLQAIPSAYHDSARVDGAGPWRRFWWITLPLLRPTVLFVLVTGVIGSFQVFTYVAVMTEGGPLHATDVVVYRIYQEAWEFLRFGTASAMSVVLLVVLLALTWLQFRWLGRRVEMT